MKDASFPWLQRRTMLVLLLSLVLAYGSPATLCAQTVTNTADSGPGSLRQAIADASPGAIIDFDPSLSGQTITLTSGEIGISQNLTITGLGASQLAVSGNTTGNGSAIGGHGGHGGGVYVGASTLTMTNSTVSGNLTGNGGSNQNGGDGGGIYAWGTSAETNNSTISDNTTGTGSGTGIDGRGGGLFNNAGTVYNLIGNGDGSSGLTDGINDDQVGTTASPIIPLLDVLGDYGGTTQTHRLQSGSPAIDKGDCSVTSPPSDQRGEARIHDEPGVPDAGDGCDVGAVEGTASELPVELVSFEALTDGRDVLLQWGTASETNNAGFYVEMSTGATRAFESLAFVDGRGTTAVPQVYRFHVEHLEPDRYVFRLKQIDYDGTFDFSPEVEVVIAPPDAFRLTAVYPNPFNPRTRFSLMVKRRQHVTVAVYNVQGHRVRTLYEGEMQARQADLV